MIFKEEGFRSVYHYVVAFELNDMLRELIKDCPDAAKSSHAVMYGYIDREQGLMLELLGGGKQAPKYFYFKDPYEGERITIKASEVADVEYVGFYELEPRFYKKFAPRIEMLKQYEASEAVEESRQFGFLDDSREPFFPDDVQVHLIKDGLDIEVCWVRITDLQEPNIVGILLNQPNQDFGKNAGDTILFNIHEKEDKTCVCVADLNSGKISREAFADGKILKKAIEDYLKNQNDDTCGFLLAVLRSSEVNIPCRVELTEDAKQILDKLKEDDRDSGEMTGEESERLSAGMTFIPNLIENSGSVFLPVFSTESEMNIPEDGEDVVIMHTPFLGAIDTARDYIGDIEGIIVNAYSDSFIVPKDIFEDIEAMDSLVDEGEKEEKNKKNKKVLISDADVKQDFFDGGKGLAIAVGSMDVFNYALYQNNICPIRDIALWNKTKDPMEGLRLKITSDYDFFREYQIYLPPIPSGKPVALPDPRLVINGKTLAGMTETVNAIITIEILEDDDVICSLRGQIMVLAYDQWQGDTSHVDLLPAFVMPNHPVIPSLLHESSNRLKKWGKESSLEGYQMGDPNRVRDLAAAAYAAIQKKNIIYSNPPASFSIIGQRIRTPESIMDQHMGTCMDMTLLYASCLEAMGLHPLLVLMKGHIFAGVWLRKRTVDELKSSNVIIEDLDELKKRINTGADDLTFIECTAMCSDKKVGFDEAEKHAKLWHLNNREDFEAAIDVFCARIGGINPLPSRTKDSGDYKVDVEDLDESDVTEAPESLDLSLAAPSVAGQKRIMNKQELWESKLLDLSLRNMLLNLSHRSGVMPIMSSNVDKLEDALSDGHEFRILPEAEFITDIEYTKLDKNGKPGKPRPWLADLKKEVGAFEITEWPVVGTDNYNDMFLKEYRNHKLYTFSSSKTIDRELTQVYRVSRASQQENGVSSLYLAIGLLRWFVDDSDDTPAYAPLILFPIEIVRKSANQGYALHARDEEPHFNTTLLEMLRQVYNIEISGVEPLPSDSHGVDIKKTFSIVRNAVLSLKNWDVVESCVIGNFSFAQFAMWNDIHTAGDMLTNSNVVRSLMKGHIDWDVEADTGGEGKITYLPITVDSSQLHAIKMAANGKTFVLHGPPGTGKSQTITGMIANLVANGKTVLFVAEKMAALSVVQKRLTQLGIGDFCLELHSDKANKKHVLMQLNKALAIHRPLFRTDFEDYQKREEKSRVKLDDYAEHLHAVHESGYSLRELIDMYEDVRDIEKSIRFDARKVSGITKENISKHIPLIRQLMADGSELDNFKDNKFATVGQRSYSADVRMDLYDYAENYGRALDEAEALLVDIIPAIEAEKPQCIENMKGIAMISESLEEITQGGAANLELAKADDMKVKAYYIKKEICQAKSQNALKYWKANFLTTDVAVYLEKCQNIEKKIFGKSLAVAGLLSELNLHTVTALEFKDVPAKLNLALEYQKAEKSLAEAEKTLSEEEREAVRTYDSAEEFEEAYDLAKLNSEKISKLPGNPDRYSEAKESLATFRKAYEHLVEEKTKVDNLLQRDSDITSKMPLEKEKQFINDAGSDPSELKDWINYNRTRCECIDAGLSPVVDAYEGGMDNRDIINAYRKGLCYALINNIIIRDNVLSNFSGVTFNESIEQFKRIDDTMLDRTKEEIFHVMASRIPDARASHDIGIEMNLLRKAIGSNARGMSIRELFARTPHLITALCPCMLMSPNSVAQYLEQENDLFDVVIFDEASQLPTCKAVGALARAKNAVIVGDPKQMPPTSFFAGSGPEVDDLALDDLDSILDDALALGIPSQYLQWHYRSTHESLIAFSNSEFYDNKMFTFPSANDRERHVNAVHVDGTYASGTNVKEAEAVVADVIRRFKDPVLKKQSVGIVTFNVKQQKLIEDLLALQYQKNSEFDTWANSGEDPVFVKNLENVQGDERDAILFSIGYGPDEKGKVSMNFGPINKPGGGKRLNVAFSRARISMTIFSSLRSTDFRITTSTPDGVVAFYDFMKFAEGHGTGDLSGHRTSENSREGILNSICKEIEAAGYQCESRIGKSDFHVDVAVIDPYDPNNYLIGIMLDGDMYKQTKNTRDREVAQISVLRNLGWKIYRIWAMDWWDNRKKVLFKLNTELEEAKEEAEKRYVRLKEEAEKLKAEEETREEESKRLQSEIEAEAARVIREEEDADNMTEVKYRETPKKSVEADSADEKASNKEKQSEHLNQEAHETSEKEKGSSDEESVPTKETDENESVASDEKENSKEIAEPVEYVYAVVPDVKISPDEFISIAGRSTIEEVLIVILEAEAPIHKDTLIKKILNVCGVNRSGAALEAIEKAMKHSKVKTSKTKGVLFCWAPGQDPKEYRGIRISNERTGEEIPPQEISNAACYVLRSGTELNKDELIKEVSRLFGYKRLGKNLEAALASGIQFARTSGVIKYEGGKYSLTS